MEFRLARMKQVRVAIAEALAKAPRKQSLRVVLRAERHRVSENLPALGKLEKESLKPLAMPVLPVWRSARLALALTAPTGPLSVP